MKAAEAHALLRALPIRDFDALFGAAPLLILAPHPDDESLACGGTIAEACARGHDIRVVILTDGSMSHPNSAAWPPERLAAQRRREAIEAMSLLGLARERLVFLDQKDSQAPHDGAAFKALAERLAFLLGRWNIGTLCTSWTGDPHGDHVAAARLAAAACRLQPVRHLAYPVWSWTVPPEADLPPPGLGARLDIGRHLPAKRRAIAAHASQHGGLIDDDPNGFRLPADFLALFDRGWEVFFEPA